jgi:hypothetical protein
MPYALGARFRLAALKQTPSLSVGLTPGGLDLPPVSAATRSVWCIATFADDPFEAPYLGGAQQRQAVVDAFGQRDGRAAKTR